MGALSTPVFAQQLLEFAAGVAFLIGSGFFLIASRRYGRDGRQPQV